MVLWKGLRIRCLLGRGNGNELSAALRRRTAHSALGCSKGSTAIDHTAEGMDRAALSCRTAAREVTMYTRLNGGAMRKGVCYDATSTARCSPSGESSGPTAPAKFGPNRRLGSGPSEVVGPCCLLPASESDTCLPYSDHPVRSEFRECPGGNDSPGLCEKRVTPRVKVTYHGQSWAASCRNPNSSKSGLWVGLGRLHSTPRHPSNHDGAFGDLLNTRDKQPGTSSSWSALDNGSPQRGGGSVPHLRGAARRRKTLYSDPHQRPQT